MINPRTNISSDIAPFYDGIIIRTLLLVRKISLKASSGAIQSLACLANGATNNVNNTAKTSSKACHCERWTDEAGDAAEQS
jgi:hypothetical protein